MLWDLTSFQLEGTKCEPAAYGCSRDKKGGKMQAASALLCDRDGRPVAVELFKGNVSDPATASTAIRRIRCRFGIERAVVIGDRGMLTEARIREDIKPGGLDWISALRAPAVRRLAENRTLRPSLFDERDLAEITCEELFPGERLVVCRNPLPAEERRRRRDELLNATEARLRLIEAATGRASRPLKGVVAITRRVDKALDKHKMRKHFRAATRDDGFTQRRNRENIAAEAALDGCYVVRTSLPETVMSADETVRSYKRLTKVERAFRAVKTVDLKVRPVCCRLADRVRAHVLPCMLAYYVEQHMREDLKPILFDDEDPPRPRPSRHPAQNAKRHRNARPAACRLSASTAS